MMKITSGFAAFLLSLVGLAASDCFNIPIAANFDEDKFFATWPVAATAWTDAAPKCYVFAADRHNSSYFTMQKYENMIDAENQEERVGEALKYVPEPGICTGLSAFNNVNEYEATIVATDLETYHLSHQCVNGTKDRALLLTKQGVYTKDIEDALKEAGKVYQWPCEFQALVWEMINSGEDGKCNIRPGQ